MDSKPIKLLTLGGGSGQFALLSGLRDLERVEITAVVSMVDSGGSTGRLRDEFGILPPGDILKCIVALSPHREMARGLLLKRFIEDRRLKGHNAGNLLLTMLSRYTESFPAGVQALAEILDVRGRILPVTVDQATLVAELTDGTRIFGEKAIDVPRGTQREKIRDVFLVPHHSESISVYPPVIDAAWWADYIVIGPGDLFTSIIAGLIVPGVKEAFRKSRAKVLYILNIMTKFGETHKFSGWDFVARLESFLGRPGCSATPPFPRRRFLRNTARRRPSWCRSTRRSAAGGGAAFMPPTCSTSRAASCGTIQRNWPACCTASSTIRRCAGIEKAEGPMRTPIRTRTIMTRCELSGAAAQPIVMLSHSLGAAMSMWDHQLAALRPRFRVLRYDTRGHGGSQAPPPPYRLDELVEDAVALLDALEIPAVHFVGLSMGGMIGQGLALGHAHRLISLVLCSTAAVMPESAQPVIQDRIDTALAEGMPALVEGTLARWFTPDFIKRRPPEVEAIRRQFLATPVAGYVGCTEAIRRLNYLEELRRLRLPTLVREGADDPGTPVSASQAIHERIRGSRLEVIPNAMHLANVERAELFNRTLVEFLRGHEPAAARQAKVRRHRCR